MSLPTRIPVVRGYPKLEGSPAASTAVLQNRRRLRKPLRYAESGSAQKRGLAVFPEIPAQETRSRLERSLVIKFRGRRHGFDRPMAGVTLFHAFPHPNFLGVNRRGGGYMGTTPFTALVFTERENHLDACLPARRVGLGSTSVQGPKVISTRYIQRATVALLNIDFCKATPCFEEDASGAIRRRPSTTGAFASH